VEHQEALTEYLWDNKDSLDRLDEASIRHFGEDDNKPSGAPNNQAGIHLDLEAILGFEKKIDFFSPTRTNSTSFFLVSSVAAATILPVAFSLYQLALLSLFASFSQQPATL
jgi:hypothetical protein